MGWQHRNVRLSDEAAQGWDWLCTARGVTLTALLEALGRILATGEDWTPDQAIDRARQIDRERRSRR
jgi:hypothetical protein